MRWIKAAIEGPCDTCVFDAADEVA